MAVFDPGTTGLDTRIYLAVHGHTTLGLRLKVVTQDHKRLSVSLSATPHILAASDRYRFSPTSWQKLVQYIALNLDTLLAYWEERLTTPALMQRLHRLEVTLYIRPHNMRTLAAPVCMPYRQVRDIECLNLVWSE
jgi:hypothetical protein